MSNNKTILVGGMMQSGSHLLYNIVRNLLEELDYGVECKYPNNSYSYKSSTGKAEYLLDKSHHFKRIHDKNPDYCIVSYRDVRDTASSWSLKRNIRDKNAIICRASENVGIFYEYKDQHKVNRLYWKYENYKNSLSAHYKYDTYFLLKNLSNFLQLDIGNYENQEIKRIFDTVVHKTENIITSTSSEKTPRSERNEWGKTGMLRSHASLNKGKIGGFKNNIDRKTLNEIQNQCKDFLVNYGYKII